MGDTTIQWTDKTWSPLRARVKADAAEIARAKGYASLVKIAEKMAGHVGPHCERVSHGCDNCYSDTNNGRCLPANGTGLPFDRRSRDLIEPIMDEKMLTLPLDWKKPQRVFVENQSDLFGDWVTDEMIDRVFAVMALCPQHTFQILSKRPQRMLRYLRASKFDDVRKWMSLVSSTMKPETEWPLPNVWLGVSVEDQETASTRTEILRQVPAAVRFISQEPQIDYIEWDLAGGLSGIHWLIQGGESGPGSRRFDLKWARQTKEECRRAGVAYFLKQVGASPIDTDPKHWQHRMRIGDGNPEYNRYIRVKLKDHKGGSMEEWPEDLRVRQFPEVA